MLSSYGPNDKESENVTNKDITSSLSVECTVH